MLVEGVPRTPSEITADWLREQLVAARLPFAGAVQSVSIGNNARWNVAETAFVSVRYRSSVSDDAPRSYFVKITKCSDPLEALLPGEYAFYASPDAAALPVPRCHVALRDKRTGGTCLLLEDMRDTHDSAQWPLPPTLPMCEAAIKTLAKSHAQSWRMLGADDSEEIAAFIDRERQFADHTQSVLPGFLSDLGDRLSKRRRSIIEAACSCYLPLKTHRLSSGQPVCRIHGDAHFWNVLYPKGGNEDDCVMIDWEDWRSDFGASDLALMIAMHWYPERRTHHEQPMMKAYFDALSAAGVRSYGPADLIDDYRLAHLCNVIVPIFQYQAGTAHASWWSHLERWFMAFEDLDCEELL